MQDETVDPPVLEGPVRLDALEDGAVWSLTLDTPKANILDTPKVRALTEAFRALRNAPHVKAVTIEGAGPHFSFGASIEEHLPERVAGMLSGFHGLFRTMLEASVPTLAVVRGQCLGGALELASFCSRVVAAPDAKLGQPEIKLGLLPGVNGEYFTRQVSLAMTRSEARAAAVWARRLTGRPFKSATRRVKLSLKSISPRMAAPVIAATSSPTPARFASSSMTSHWMSVESMSKTIRRR